MTPLIAAITRDLPSSKLAYRVLLEWLITAIASMLLIVWLIISSVAERSNHVFYDTVSELTAASPHPDIVVVAIDDRSLDALGAWPWPRRQHAALIDRLKGAGVRSIAYDVLFIEPTADDALLAAAIAKAGNVYLPAAVDTPGMDGSLASVTYPVASISQAAAGIGHSVLTPEPDGTVRRLPLWISADGYSLAHLGAIALSEHPRAPRLPRPDIPNPDAANLDEPLSTTGIRLIRYPSGEAPYPTVSFSDVLRGEVHPDFLRNKRVLVGATAQGMGDRYAIPTNPTDSLTPGVNIVGAFMQEIITGKPIKVLSPFWVTLLSFVPLVLILIAFLLLSPATNMVLGILLIISTLLMSALLLVAGIWWPPLAACAGVIFAWPLWSWRRLAAAYHYMQSELNDLQSDTATHNLSALSNSPDWRYGDEISRQVLALSSTLKQFRDFNRYIAQAISGLPDATILADPNGIILIANRRAEGMFEGQALKDSRLDDLFDRLGYREWRSLIDSDPTVRDEIILEDGRCLSVAIAPLFDTHQQSAGLILRLADVTRLRAAERERQMTLQLLGHDMRAPQVSILTLLANDTRGPEVDDKIRRNANQTLSLAEGYVQLSRAENQTLNFTLLDLSDLVTEAIDTLWPQSAAKGVELIAREDGLEYLIKADSALMRRVIINLLDNAIRHTPTGGYVACKLSIHNDRVLLIICDQGTGLEEDMKQRLFKPFAGGNVSGAGLGLAFVHTVIQRHGGTISIDPPEGIEKPATGACFYITLPLENASPF